MRNFNTAFPPEFLRAFQAGTLGYTYKGIPCLKNPIDLAIYTKLIWDCGRAPSR
jgi:cephalosporin hydroxylase